MGAVTRSLGIVMAFVAIGLFMAGFMLSCDKGARSEAFSEPGGASAPDACRTIVYVPALDDAYATGSTLKMTSLFEDMFAISSPHPIVDNRAAIPVCEPFSPSSGLVIAAVERALASLPAYSRMSVRVSSLEACPPDRKDEHGVLARFAFADASGVRGSSILKASLVDAGCNQWVVVAVGEREGPYCRNFKTTGTLCPPS